MNKNILLYRVEGGLAAGFSNALVFIPLGYPSSKRVIHPVSSCVGFRGNNSENVYVHVAKSCVVVELVRE